MASTSSLRPADALRLRTCIVVAALGLLLSGCPDDGEAGISGGDVSGSDSAGTIDVGSDTGAPLDVGSDSGQPDAGPDAGPTELPEWIGQPCADASSCPGDDTWEAYCVQGADGENICTVGCVTQCPAGFGCVGVQNAGTDGLLLCMPNKPVDCNTCETDADCIYDGARCVAIGSDGDEPDMRCATDCSDSPSDCGAGYQCVTQDDGAQLCVPESESCICFGALDGSTRDCEKAAEGIGTCYGSQTCDGPNGWGACSATTPMAEICNGLDDDCDGQSDEDLSANSCEKSNDFGTCTGLEVCGGEAGWSCGAQTPAEELCDEVDNDCDGETDEGMTDTDDDGQCDDVDTDDDGDGIDDGDDNCQFAANPEQTDTDNDGDGDACDGDKDNDGIADESDNCPTVPNSNPAIDLDTEGNQKDFDNDGIGDACDPDKDNDGSLPPQDCNDYDPTIGEGFEEVCDGKDNNCDATKDEGFSDSDNDQLKDCVDGNDDNDADSDEVDCAPLDPTINSQAVEVCDGIDNDCKGGIDDGDPAEDPGFLDTDDDGEKDCVDTDIDGDGVDNEVDNCPYAPNPTQLNADDDPFGNVCDTDDDNDGVLDDQDNCPLVANEDQTNLDGDDQGDACDPDPDGDQQEAPLDCAPFDPEVYDGATEVCDGKDNDCDVDKDEGFPDTDNDGVADCVDPDIDGDLEPNESDCEPLNGAVFPDQTELCDGIDNNCNIAIDEGCPPTDVNVIFPSAVVTGTTSSGLSVQISVGMPGVVGSAPSSQPDAFGVDWGFYHTLP